MEQKHFLSIQRIVALYPRGTQCQSPMPSTESYEETALFGQAFLDNPLSSQILRLLRLLRRFYLSQHIHRK